MPIELSKEQHEVLKQTGRVETPAELQTLLAQAKPRMDQIVRETLEPAQPVATTLTELRDLALTVHQYAGPLVTKGYGSDKRAAFFDAIRMLDTAQAWFGEGIRTGAFRTRSVEEVVAASRPWRARIKAFGEHAYAFEPEIAELFADTNTSGTLPEEVEDLGRLNYAVEQHRPKLEEVGLTEKHVQEGKALYEEASGRDITGIMGLRNQAEATLLRNRILTFVILLGREARAAGVNACWEDLEARRRFETASFRDALRRLRPRRGRGADPAPEGNEPPPTKGGSENAPA